jgi:hypothetical protein
MLFQSIGTSPAITRTLRSLGTFAFASRSAARKASSIGESHVS